MNHKSLSAKTRLILLGAGSATLALTAGALPEDNQQPINIQANRATQQSVDSGEKTEYYGDVVMTQGSLLVNADHITIHSVNRKVTQIVAIGNPAKFQQQSNPDQAPVKARANNIDYQLTTERVVLTENANIQQPDAEFSGNRIEYNVATEEVIAEDRVNMVFTPASISTATDGDAPATEQDSPSSEHNKDQNGDSAGH